jgi:uncharacterized membrane protein
MKSIEFIKREAINWLFISSPFIYLIIVYKRMPKFALLQINKEQAIYHVLFFIMGVAVFWYIKLLVQPSIVPKTPIHDNLKSVHRMKTIMLAYLSLLCLAFISEKAGISFNWQKITFLFAMVFLIFLGNLYPTVRYNYFFGIRNSWTLSNEIIWRKTHLLSGRICFWIGIAGALIGIFFSIPANYLNYSMLGFIFVNFILVRAYSYFLYKRLHNHAQHE